tara:strand:+ start:494 stop:847 length:354 start_codon:yes stop_codon:yes gene_type:complete
MMFSAGSELRKGFTMPTIKKIKAVLRTKSKTFLINLIISMMSGMSKTAKIKVLIKIDRRKVAKKAKKRKSKTAKRKTAKRKTTKSKGKKRGKGFQGKPRGSKEEKRAIASAQRKRKR